MTPVCYSLKKEISKAKSLRTMSAKVPDQVTPAPTIQLVPLDLGALSPAAEVLPSRKYTL